MSDWFIGCKKSQTSFTTTKDSNEESIITILSMFINSTRENFIDINEVLAKFFQYLLPIIVTHCNDMKDQSRSKEN